MGNVRIDGHLTAAIPKSHDLIGLRDIVVTPWRTGTALIGGHGTSLFDGPGFRLPSQHLVSIKCWLTFKILPCQFGPTPVQVGQLAADRCAQQFGFGRIGRVPILHRRGAVQPPEAIELGGIAFLNLANAIREGLDLCVVSVDQIFFHLVRTPTGTSTLNVLYSMLYFMQRDALWLRDVLGPGRIIEPVQQLTPQPYRLAMLPSTTLAARHNVHPLEFGVCREQIVMRH